MRVSVLFLLLISFFVSTHSTPAVVSNATSSVRPVHTYSIVARDPATGELGVAVQSHWFSVGPIVAWAEAGVGAVATQASVEHGRHQIQVNAFEQAVQFGRRYAIRTNAEHQCADPLGQRDDSPPGA